MNNKIYKIIVPILIVAIVFGIYALKKGDKEDNVASDIKVETLNIEELKKEKLPIVLDFTSATCPPCREMEPTIHKLSEQYKGKVIIKSVSTDVQVKGAEDFPVKVTPTLFFYDKDGKPYTPSSKINIDLIKYSSKSDNKHLYTAREGLLTEEEFLDIFKDMGVK